MRRRRALRVGVAHRPAGARVGAEIRPAARGVGQAHPVAVADRLRLDPSGAARRSAGRTAHMLAAGPRAVARPVGEARRRGQRRALVVRIGAHRHAGAGPVGPARLRGRARHAQPRAGGGAAHPVDAEVARALGRRHAGPAQRNQGANRSATGSKAEPALPARVEHRASGQQRRAREAAGHGDGLPARPGERDRIEDFLHRGGPSADHHHPTARQGHRPVPRAGSQERRAVGPAVRHRIVELGALDALASRRCRRRSASGRRAARWRSGRRASR